MIMNYVLSFCKITAASRIFSRNFYLPLLKPITPKDALRTFKITGKWLLGSKIQHYIPVLYNHKNKRSKRIKNFGKLDHKYDDSFTYMAPIFDDDNENHRRLKGIIEAKCPGEPNNAFFIYSVDDKMTNVVFPGKFELAIQDGDIIDILISQSDDKVLVKLKDFKKIPLQLQYYDKDDLKCTLKKGEGATTVEEEKFHHHGKMTMKLAKIFEAKEMAEEWEQEMIKIVAKKKKQKGEGTKEWQEMVSQTIENINWQQFEVEAKKVIDQIWEPAHEEHIGMVVEDLEKTRNVPEFFNNAGNALMDCLPTLIEIPDIVKNMATAVYEELEDDSGNHRICGVRVILSNGKECFITGQMVKTDDGDIFIPGQTIENEFGLSYAPGMTVLLDGKPQLIKGLIMGESNPENGNEQKPMFLPTESSITNDGALTFCRNPEELSKAQPHKIFVKRKNKKKKKKPNDANELNGEHIVVEQKEEEKQRLQTEQELMLLEEVESFQVVVNDLEVIAESEEPTQEQIDQNEDDNLAFDVIPVIEPIITVEPINEAEKTQSEEDLDEFIKLERLVELQELQQLEFEESKVQEIEEVQRAESIKSGEEFSFKNPDDGMEKLIGSLEDKKSELQEKLEKLRCLSVTLENSVTYIQPEDAENLSKQITPNSDYQHKIAEILFTLTRRMYMFRERMNVNIKNIKNLDSFVNETNDRKTSSLTDIDDRFDKASINLKRTLMSALYAANEVFKTRPKDQQLALKTLATILNNEMNGKKQVEEVCSVWMDREEVCTSAMKMLTQKVRECRVVLLKQLANEFDTEKCVDILDGGVLAEAIKNLAKNSPEVCDALQLELQTKIDLVKTESAAKEILQVAIRDACTAYAEDLLMNFNIHDEFEYDEIIQEAIGLAETLGLYEVQDILGNRNEVLRLLKRKAVGCDKARDFLQRFHLIRELCHKDYSIKSSLERIRKHPECGRKDPRIRQLLIASACLMSKQRDLRSSLEVPLQLFKEQNFLAIEDSVYLRTRVDSPIVISRKGIQCVVPKECAKNVIAGRVAYTLIDESGVTNFKPMHMFKMSRGKKSSYSNDVRRTSLSDARMAA